MAQHYRNIELHCKLLLWKCIYTGVYNYEDGRCMHVVVVYNVYTYIISSRRQAQQSSGELVVKGVYGVVRHPMYSGLLIAVWSQPTMVCAENDLCSL